jgi:cellulase (glycosyl hydrolase family 5)
MVSPRAALRMNLTRVRGAILGLVVSLSLAAAVAPQAQAATGQMSPTAAATAISNLKIISYYPSADSWNSMWTSWYPGVIYNDMGLIAGLDANTVRVFIEPSTFGYPTPSATYVSELQQLVNMAQLHGLKVQLTLFDEFTNYSDIAGSEQWAKAILAPYYNDPAIAFVELQNEINPTNATAMSWARTMLPALRTDSGLPVTVSVTGWNSPAELGQLYQALGSSQPDFYDYHFYGVPTSALAIFQQAKLLVNGAPLLIGETGYSTSLLNNSWFTTPLTQAQQNWAQEVFLADVEQAANQAGLPPAGVWTLYDFPGSATLSDQEQHFGLYTTSGVAKPAAAVLQNAFETY